MAERYGPCPICAGRGKIPELEKEEIVHASDPIYEPEQMEMVRMGVIQDERFTILLTIQQTFVQKDCGHCGSTGFSGSADMYKG